MEEAEAILRELDLGPLLARMPAGLEQLVGERGWQLSHGGRSRLFIARALLQPLDACVLDGLPDLAIAWAPDGTKLSVLLNTTR